MSLRSRVILGFLAIAILLVAADLVLAVNVQRSLVDQVDQRLAEAADRFAGGAPGSRPGQGPGPGRIPLGQNGPPPGVLPEDLSSSVFSEYFLVVLASDGTVERELSPTLRGGDPSPVIDPQIAIAHAVPIGQPIAPFTVGSGGGSDLRYRVAVVQRGNGGYAVTGISLREADATFSRLLWVELAATGAVLVLLGLVAFWVIRLGVRPIGEMADTANAIAEGDLSRRVTVASPRTEAGQLGVALNAMLHQIEGAFAERQASEGRLRRFVADASHELRTPLTSIRGYTELYRSGAIATGAPLEDAMRRIEGESERMGELVDDLLLLARLDQGRPLETRPVDLGALARDAVADARAVEPDRPIGIETPDAPTVVIGDEQRLRQVVGNLVANARLHTPEGTPVEVRVWSTGEHAVLEVADEGPGIAPADAEHLFERFYRGDPARARSETGAGSGAGLGLSIVSAVAEAHHGRAWVEPHAGPGARLRVEIPLAP
jgi:two-component system OmpR family sensor kinase